MPKHESNNQETLTTVLGAGGPYAISYDSGIFTGLREKGIDIHAGESKILGTSGGAWTAGFIVTEKQESEVESIPQVEFPNRDPEYLLEIGRKTFGDARSARIGAAALRLPSLRNPLPAIEILRGDEHDIAEIAAATSAIPLGYHPVRLDGKWFVDGGARSMTHAHRAPAADHMLVIAALAKHFRPSIGPLSNIPAGRIFETMAYQEMRSWKNKHKGKPHLIRPNRAIGGLVEHFSDLFDKKIAKRTYEMAIEQAHELVETRPNLATLAIEMTQRNTDAI